MVTLEDVLNAVQALNEKVDKLSSTVDKLSANPTPTVPPADHGPVDDFWTRPDPTKWPYPTPFGKNLPEIVLGDSSRVPALKGEIFERSLWCYSYDGRLTNNEGSPEADANRLNALWAEIDRIKGMSAQDYAKSRYYCLEPNFAVHMLLIRKIECRIEPGDYFGYSYNNLDPKAYSDTPTIDQYYAALADNHGIPSGGSPQNPS